MKTGSPAEVDLPVEKNHSPSTSVKVWSVLIFVAPFALFGYWMFQVRQDSKAMLVSVPVESLDFGTVWMQDDFEWTIPVTNRSDKEINILGFGSSCNCTSILPKKCSLAPGETIDLELVINLAPKNKEASQLIRDFAVLITPQIEDELSPHHDWMLQGRVQSAVSFSVASLRFENVLASKYRDLNPKAVKIIAGQHVEKIEVSCEKKYGIAKIRQIDLANREYELSVSLSDSIPVGPYGFTVAINAFGKNGQPLPKMNFPVHGRFLANVRAIPPSLDFAPLKIGDLKRDTILLNSITGRPFRVLKVDFEEGSGISLSKNTTLPQSSARGGAEFRIEQTALVPGDQSTKIIFNVQEGKSKRIVKIPVVVSYHGLNYENNSKR